MKLASSLSLSRSLLIPLSSRINKHCFVVVQIKQKTEIINWRETTQAGISKKNRQMCMYVCVCVFVFVWKWVCASLFIVCRPGPCDYCTRYRSTSASRKPQLQQQQQPLGSSSSRRIYRVPRLRAKWVMHHFQWGLFFNFIPEHIFRMRSYSPNAKLRLSAL